MSLSTPDRLVRRCTWVVSLVFALALVVFAFLRFSVDSVNFGSADSLGADNFDRRYAEHPVIAYLHIVPGVVFVTLAPFQLARPLRCRWPSVHRGLGRIAVPAGLVSAVFGVVFGVLFPWGGFAESSASVVFGIYMAMALWLGLGHARNRNLAGHRRWMIRAFAVSLGVATIRVILAAGGALDLYEFDDVFGVAFWIGLSINALAAEAWIRRWPSTYPATRRKAGAV